MPRSTKPQGQPTRGKTASNRLRRVDNFILLYEPSLLARIDGLFADSMFVGRREERHENPGTISLVKESVAAFASPR